MFISFLQVLTTFSLSVITELHAKVILATIFFIKEIILNTTKLLLSMFSDRKK